MSLLIIAVGVDVHRIEHNLAAATEEYDLDGYDDVDVYIGGIPVDPAVPVVDPVEDPFEDPADPSEYQRESMEARGGGREDGVGASRGVVQRANMASAAGDERDRGATKEVTETFAAMEAAGATSVMRGQGAAAAPALTSPLGGCLLSRMEVIAAVESESEDDSDCDSSD